jgi:hypothetical protein
VLEECWSRTMELHKLDVVVAGHYSPECVEGEFSEVRRHGVLRSSSNLHSRKFRKGSVLRGRVSYVTVGGSKLYVHKKPTIPPASLMVLP